MPTAEGAVGSSQPSKRAAEDAERIRIVAEACRDGSIGPITADFKGISKTSEALAMSIEPVSHFAERLNAVGEQLVEALDGGKGGLDRI